MQIRLRQLGDPTGWFAKVLPKDKIGYTRTGDQGTVFDVTDDPDGQHVYLRTANGYWLAVERDGHLGLRPPDHLPGDFERWMLASRPPHHATILATVELDPQWWSDQVQPIMNAWLVEPVS